MRNNQNRLLKNSNEQNLMMMREYVHSYITKMRLQEGKLSYPKGPFKMGQFRNLKNLDERKSYLHTRTDTKLLDWGSSRKVYMIESQKKVIKLALWQRGKAQNKTEAQIVEQSGEHTRRYLPELYGRSSNYSWIIVDAVNPIKSAGEFQRTLGFNNQNIETASKFFISDYVSPKQKIKSRQLYDQLSKKNPWFGGLIRLIKRFNLEPGDVSKWDSWGITRRGRIVLLDFGLTPDIWNRYYK